MYQHDINSFYIYLQSEQTAQSYLYQCYRQLHEQDAERKSYENCNVFRYYIEHGWTYYNAGKKLDMVLKPVMLFYGMAHLLKACLLTIRPDYPESTSVLAHGLSTRKRKKKNYSFLVDEVKIQHNGLFPYVSEHLFGIKQHPFEKVTMKSLLQLLPELRSLWKWEEEDSLWRVGRVGDHTLSIPTAICDDYFLTEKAFITRLAFFLPEVMEIKRADGQMLLHLNEPIQAATGPFVMDMDFSIYLPRDKAFFTPISEVMLHYLVLYNLSMLSRYEAEWWGELITIKPDIDFPIIAQFLSVTEKKIPYLLGLELYKKKENGTGT